MHPDHIAEGVGVRLQHMLHQLLLTDPAVPVEHQVLQNGKLSGRQLQRPFSGGDSTGGYVQHETTHSKYRISGDKLPAQQAADSGLQLLQGKGFREIVVCPQIQPRHPVG